MLVAVWEGLRWVMAHPLIRPLALASAVYSFFEIGVLQTLYVLFVIEEPGIPPTWVGFILAVGGPGAIVGAWISVRLMKGFGPGPTMLWCTIVGNSILLLVPLAGGPLWLAATMLIVSQFFVGLTTQVFLVNHLTLLQTITPSAMAGRVVATIWSLGLVPAPLGALLGGLLGGAIGLRETMLGAAILGAFIPILTLLFSPIPQLKEMPEGPIEQTPAVP
jgi:predicted MFS family arabinose efflux permease